MGGGWLARRTVGDLDDLEGWMAQRNADISLRPDAEAAGREAWEQATRSGRDLAAPQPSDLVGIGAGILNSNNPESATPTPSSANSESVDDPVRAQPIPSDGAGRFDDASPSYGFAGPLPDEFDCGTGLSVGPNLAQGAGIVAGLFRGALHTGADALRTASFMAKAANPLDVALSPPGRSARDEIADAVGRLGSYADDRISHPDHFGEDLQGFKHQFATDLFPGATPTASTLQGERLRRFRIGENQGELGFNVGLAVAAPASEIGEYLMQGKAGANVDRFVKQGFAPETAEFLASPYEGMGHHSLARSAGWPAEVADSPFFLVKPPWMNRGRFYERHYAVDPHFYGAKIRASAGGGSWSGKALDLTKYGPLGQFWFGTTTPFKAAAGAELIANSALADQVTAGNGPP
jgi:hypothetical protein